VDFRPIPIIGGTEPFFPVNRGFSKISRKGGFPSGVYILEPDAENGWSPSEMTIGVFPSYSDPEGGTLAAVNAEIVSLNPDPALFKFGLQVNIYLTGGAYEGFTLEDVPFWVKIHGIQ
jgi:hypothetical protein